MTVEKLHDALNLLPGDLITATDRVRTAPKTKVIHWKRWVSLAACLVLVLSTALVFRKEILPGKGGKTESAAQAPAAMAPVENGPIAEISAEEAAPEEAPMTDAANDIITGSSETPAEESLSIDHSHSFAEESDRTVNAPAYCGNMVTTVYLNGAEYSFGGSDSVRITDILTNLPYEPGEICRCMAEFTVDTEMLSGIEVNLTEGFARCDQGQAALTEIQAEEIRTIIESLE